jgi:hypothetical protein
MKYNSLKELEAAAAPSLTAQLAAELGTTPAQLMLALKTAAAPRTDPFLPPTPGALFDMICGQMERTALHWSAHIVIELALFTILMKRLDLGVDEVGGLVDEIRGYVAGLPEFASPQLQAHTDVVINLLRSRFDPASLPQELRPPSPEQSPPRWSPQVIAGGIGDAAKEKSDD